MTKREKWSGFLTSTIVSVAVSVVSITYGLSEGAKRNERKHLEADGCSKLANDPELWECADGLLVELRDGTVVEVER